MRKSRVLQPELPRWQRLEERIGRTREGGRKAIPIAARRELILRASWKCEYEDSECNGALGIHHIDENPDNNELSNLMLLCNLHHRRDHRREYGRETSTDRKEKKRLWDRLRYLRTHPDVKIHGKDRKEEITQLTTELLALKK